MFLSILQIMVTQLLLPVAFIYSLWRIKVKNRLDWVIQTLFTIIFILWLFLSGRWDWVGYYLRYIWLILLIPAVYVSWRKTRSLPFRTKINTSQMLSRGTYIVLLVIFGLYNVFIFFSYTTQEEGIELAFPLEEGTYYVGHGGSTTPMNYHNAYKPQQYALDIVKLNKFGLRANGLYPTDLNKYAIYSDTLYSPCNGEVVEVRNHLADLTPPATDPEQPEGNYIALACENTDAVLYIAHMQEGSITVDEGIMIHEGQPIGSVGNSGNTSEPHLHIHAEEDGVGIPIRFDGKFLTRNSLVY